MNKDLQNRLYAVNLILVAVDQKNGSDYSGRIYTKYEREPRSFNGMGEMINLMDAQYDRWCFPQSASINRAFTRKGFQKNAARVHSQQSLIEYADTVPHYDAIFTEQGKLGSFYVQTRFRQNATWQGDVYWLEEDRWSGFSSALELMKLMDDASSEACIEFHTCKNQKEC